MNPIIISSNRRQIKISLLASTAFVVLCSWMLTFLADENRPLFLFTAIFALPLFSYSAIMSLKLLISEAPVFTINKAGIIDKASGLSVGFIPWSDVLSTKIILIKKIKFLQIHLKNQQEYVKKASLPRRLLMRLNVLFGGSAISISERIMTESIEDVIASINQFKLLEQKQLQDRNNRFFRNNKEV
jgi:hypothetical protein